MKEGRIFEYTVQHISVFKNLFEVLSGVLHEVEMIHIKPEKPIDAEKDDSEDESNSENSNSDSENESDKSLTKQEKNDDKGGIKIVEINDFESIVIILKLDAINFFKFDLFGVFFF